MNISMILYFLGWVLKIEGILMILPCAIALIYQELSGLYFLGIGLFCVTSGWLMSRKNHPIRSFMQKKDLSQWR